MDKNMLINFHRILVFIRFDIYRLENKLIIDLMVNSLINNYPNSIFVEAVNKELSQCRKINDISCDLFTTTNDCINDVELNEIVRCVLLPIMEKIQLLIKNEIYDEAYEIVDVTHALVEVLANSETSNLHDFWKIYMEPLISKWKICSLIDLKKYFIALQSM